MSGVKAVVGAGSVKQFAAAIANALAKQATGNPYEGDEPDPVTREAIADLTAAVREIENLDAGDGVLFAPDNQTAALMMSFLAERQAEADVEATVFETQLAHNDLTGWVTQFAPAWIQGRFNKRPFVAPSLPVVQVENQFRLAVLGDWGSGLYGAPVSAATIERTVPRFDSVLHLGDVYYAGTEKEVTERFLNIWPNIPEATSWALNSNHEMFSGGAGYFGKTLNDERFLAQRGSSCFAWENEHFVFLGLDTAYENHSIGPEQLAWIEERARAGQHKKLILFSHHQPFSAFESAGSKLVAALSGLLESGRIKAWYWGHEHRCVFFEKHPRWSLWGRCVGHGGFPQARDRFELPAESTNHDGSNWRQVTGRPGVPSGWALDGPNRYIIGKSEKYSPHGFVNLYFDGPVIHETVHAPDGALLLAHDAS